jgi:predicted Fe-Mo cluster-binding NifX family protein
VSRERPRVLVVEFARPDPAAVALGRVLRDEGMEVVHAGPLDTVDQIVRTAEQEDPDAVAVLGERPPPDLEQALDPVRVVPVDAAKSLEEAVKLLSGGRSHTAGPPSDRVR